MSLFRRTNSKYWWFKFYFGGELIQKSSQVTNKRDALTVESGYRTQLALGKLKLKPKEKAPAFSQAADDFLKMSEVEHAQKPNSFIRIKHSCQSLKKFFKETKVDRIEPKDVENFIRWRSRQTSKKTKKTVTRDTINLELIALKTIFKRLVSKDILDKSPARDIKQLAPNERSFHVITDDEEKLYLMACPQPLQDVAALMLATGMRPNEIYELKRRNVNLEQGFLQIVGSKTKSSNRKVWLSERTTRILKLRIDRFTGEYLFPKGEKDGADATNQLNNQHQTAIKRAKLKFRLYDCRHTFATRVLENGVDLLTLASMLGHSSLDEVMRYAHPSEASKKDAANQMQKRKAKAV